MSIGYSLVSDQLAELNLELTKPDVVVRPIVGHFGTLQKVDPQVLYDEGYRAMVEELPTLQDAFSYMKSIKRISKYTTASTD